jgi:guanylate kinase
VESTSDPNNPVPSQQGRLIVLSGPSGSGKSTLVRELLADPRFNFEYSVSATTRKPRSGEEHSKHYVFLSRDEFIAKRDNGEFLEFAEVHGNLYGTPNAKVEEALQRGKWVLLEIDVNGHRQVKAKRPDAVSFFVRSTSMEDYRRRLEERATDSPEAIEQRVRDSRIELKHAKDYDFQIVNEEVPQAVRCFKTLLWGLQAQGATQ